MLGLSRKSGQEGREKDNTTAEKICTGTTPRRKRLGKEKTITNMLYQEEFPSLFPRRTQQNNVQSPRQEQVMQTANTTDQGTSDDMFALIDEFNTLNNLVNIAPEPLGTLIIS